MVEIVVEILEIYKFSITTLDDCGVDENFSTSNVGRIVFFKKKNKLPMIITDVEECLNNRPLFPVSSDPNHVPNMSLLTLGHFLIGDSLYALLEVETKILIKRLNRCRRVSQY